MDRVSLAHQAIFELKNKLAMPSASALPVAPKAPVQTPIKPVISTPLKPLNDDQQEAILFLLEYLPKVVSKLDELNEGMQRVGIHPSNANTPAGEFFRQIKNPLGTCCFTLSGVYAAMLDLYHQGGINRVQ